MRLTRGFSSNCQATVYFIMIKSICSFLGAWLNHHIRKYMQCPWCKECTLNKQEDASVNLILSTWSSKLIWFIYIIFICSVVGLKSFCFTVFTFKVHQTQNLCLSLNINCSLLFRYASCPCHSALITQPGASFWTLNKWDRLFPF